MIDLGAWVGKEVLPLTPMEISPLLEAMMTSSSSLLLTCSMSFLGAGILLMIRFSETLLDDRACRLTLPLTATLFLAPSRVTPSFLPP